MDTNKIREALNAAHGYIEYQYRRALEVSEQRAIDGTRLDLDNINEALAELDKAQQPGKMLTDEEIDHIADTTPPPSRAKSYAEYCAEEAGFVRGLRYARDNGYLAPAAGLTVEEVIGVVIQWYDSPIDYGHSDGEELYARLTAAIEAKTRTA